MLKGHFLDSEDFLTLLLDPKTHQPNPLIENLQNTTGPYSYEDDIFVVCTGAVWMSRVAAYTLQALVSGRGKDNAREHAKKFKWPKPFALTNYIIIIFFPSYLLHLDLLIPSDLCKRF